MLNQRDLKQQRSRKPKLRAVCGGENQNFLAGHILCKGNMEERKKELISDSSSASGQKYLGMLVRLK